MSEENDTGQNVEVETTESPFSKEISICKLCKENLENKEGRLLFCLHSYCQQCVENLIVSSETAAPAQGFDVDVVKCPECGQSCRRKDIIVNKFVTLSTSENSPDADENKTCTGCDEGVDATSFCTECQEFLCDTCVNAHKRVKMTKDHTIQSKDNAPSSLNTSNSSQNPELYCTVHTKEPLKLFCETCDKLTCRDCQLIAHKDHKYYFVDEAAMKIKEILYKLQAKMNEKQNYVSNAKDLLHSRTQEIQERQEKVSNDIKVFALKIIAEVNKRGKQLLDDLNALCNAKKAQLEYKGKGVNSIAARLEYALKFLEFAVEKGSNEALLYSKKVIINQLRTILAARCEVPNPHHKVDIRFQWDSSFGSVHVPKQGMLLVDGINFQGLSKDKQARLIQQGLGDGPELQQQQQHPAMLAHMRHQAGYQNHRGPVPILARPPPPPQLQGLQQGLPQQGGYPPHGYPGRPLPPNQMFNPHQSATISSSHQRNISKSGMFFPPQSQQQHHVIQQQQHQQQQQQQQVLLQQQQRSVTLAQLQQERMRRMQAGVSSTSVPPSPIVIQPMAEDTPGHLVPNSPQLAPMPSGGAPMVLQRPGSSPHGSNTPSPQQVGSTTGTSPEQRMSLPETRMKPESSERPSCSFGASSPKSTQNSGADPRAVANSMSLNDFNFDQDPMAFIKNITQEFDNNRQASATEVTATEQMSGAGTSHSTSSNEAVASSAQRKQPTGTASTVDTEKRPAKPSTPQPGGPEKSATPEVPAEAPAPPTKKAPVSLPTGKDASVMAATMPSSQESDPSEDWCAVCNNGGDLLCCDRCPKVFHIGCHVPTLKKAPSGEWFCNLCEKIEDIRLDKAEPRDDTVTTESGAIKRKLSSALSAKEQKVCERILLELYSSRATPPFHEPVSPSVPHYYEVIKHPMDMKTIKRKLRRSHPEHYRSVEEFLQDVQLVFTNCARYNAAESEMGVIGREVEAFFHSWVRKLLPYIDIQPVTKETPALLCKDGDGPPRAKARRASAGASGDVATRNMEELQDLVQLMKDGEDVETVLGLMKQVSNPPRPALPSESQSKAGGKVQQSVETGSDSAEKSAVVEPSQPDVEAPTGKSGSEEVGSEVGSASVSEPVVEQSTPGQDSPNGGMVDDDKADPDYVPGSQEIFSDPDSVPNTPKK